MKPSELPGARRLYRLTNHALAQIRELWQYAGEDELPPDSLLQAHVEALRILRIDVPLSAKRQFQLFCSEHFPGLADILDCLAADQLWALLSMRVQLAVSDGSVATLEMNAGGYDNCMNQIPIPNIPRTKRCNKPDPVPVALWHAWPLRIMCTAS